MRPQIPRPKTRQSLSVSVLSPSKGHFAGGQEGGGRLERLPQMRCILS